MRGIPLHAKLVFNGVLFNVYQWKQKIFDGSYRTFEKLVRTPSVEIIVPVENKIIVLYQSQPSREPFFSLVGGLVDPHENHLQAAHRELKEETGYTAAKMDMLLESFGTSKIVYHVKVFIARGCKKTAIAHPEGGEKILVKYYDFEQFLTLCRKGEGFAVSPALKQIMFECLLDTKKKTAFRKKIFGTQK